MTNFDGVRSTTLILIQSTDTNESPFITSIDASVNALGDKEVYCKLIASCDIRVKI